MKYGDLSVGDKVVFRNARSCIFEVVKQNLFMGVGLPRLTILKCVEAARSFERTHGWGTGELWWRDVGDTIEDHGGTVV